MKEIMVVTRITIGGQQYTAEELGEKKVKEITEILFENKAELQYILPTDISLDESQATEGITIPFHDGAAVYYEEHGISMNEE